MARHLGGRVGAQSGGESGVAGEIAQHPEDVSGLGAVIDGRDGLGERLAGAFAGAGGLGERERGAAGLERFERFLAAACCFSSQRVPMKWATPSLSQARGDLHPGVGEGVGKDAGELVGRGLANGGGEQRAGFKGCVLGVGQIEDGELGAGRLAQPALQKRRDCGGGRGPAVHGGFVCGENPERGVGGCFGVRMATKRLGASKPRVALSRLAVATPETSRRRCRAQ